MVSFTTSPYVPALILLLTLPILALLIVPHILPPSRLSITHSDELDDLSLFDKAIHADRDFKKQPHRHPHPHRPSNKIRFNSNAIKSPKIAFLFLTDSDLTFSPIWNLYFNQTDAHLFNIYVHSDPYIKIKSLDGFLKDRIIPSKRTQRSSPTLISAARRLLATAILDDPRNLYFALISQHCVPLHSFAFFYNTLFDADGINQGLPSYIEIIDKEVNLWDRYNARGMDY